MATADLKGSRRRQLPRSSMRHEIEVKLPVADRRAIRRRLAELGFKPVLKRHFERNSLLDFPDRRLRKEGCLLRIRRAGSRIVLTFKGRRVRSGRFKVRPEIETRLIDEAPISEIFEKLGLRVAFRYEKYRTIFRRSSDPAHTEIAYDETPIGTYLELEGPRQWIDRVARELNYRPADYITASYGRLYLWWCEAHGRTPKHMLFAQTGVI